MELNLDQLGQAVLASLVFSAIGLVFFGISYVILEKLSPFSIKKELIEDQNVALGIVVGCMVLGIALIVSAAMHG